MTTPAGQAQVVPAWSGWRSLLQAGDLIGQRWQVYLQVIMLWLAVSLLLGLIPAGNLLLLLLAPLLQGGVALMFHLQLQHGRLQPMQLFSMFGHAQRNTLIVAMLWLLLIIFALVVLLLMPFADLLQQLQSVKTMEDLLAQELPQQQIFWLLCGMTAAIAVMSLLWFFAVPRIVFDLLPAGAALQDSLRACVRNWRALLTFGMASVVIITAAVFMLVMINLLPTLLLGEAAAMVITELLVAFMTTALQVLNVGGVYLLWRQVYPRADDNGQSGADEETRFLA